MKHSIPAPSLFLATATLATLPLGCSMFETEDTPTAQNDSGTGGADDGGWFCGGRAFTRTDDPGTAVCLDGTETFECAWGGSETTSGVRVEGDFDGEILTLYFPDFEGATHPEDTTPFMFLTLFDYNGHDLVLEYQSSRVGEYMEVGSWAEAVAGDGGVCGGSGGSGTDGTDGDGGGDASDTCEAFCSDDTDCNAGESCLDSEIGSICLPSECSSCWSSGSSCTYDGTSCGFVECGSDGGDGDGGGDTSNTCQASCGDDTDCNAGESCLDSESGRLCLPSECSSCWSGGASCSFDGTSCDFVECDGGSDTSSTCLQACTYDSDCSSGESCSETTDGTICIPSECESCFDSGLQCNANTDTCEFNECS